MSVLVDGGLDDVQSTPVVPEMNHLGTGRLQDASEDVDRRIVTVEKGGGRDESDLVGQIQTVIRCFRHGSWSRD